MVTPRSRVRFALVALGSAALTCALAGCSAAPSRPEVAPSAATTTTPTPPPDPDAKFAPFPFTATQIHDACPEGRTIVLVEEVPGKEPVKKRMRFLAVDDERATIASDILDERDAPVGDAKTEIATWDELRHHAAFAKEHTTVSEATAETPLGSFPCTRYVVEEGDVRTTVCFARSLPGPPIELQIEKAGKLVMSLTMVKSS